MAAERESSPAPPCELLEWDSEHFGFPIARVLAGTLTSSSVQAIDAWCVERGIRCLYFVADADDPETARLAAAHGFRVVDLRIIARRSYEGLLELPQGSEEVTIREATNGDLEYARRLAARSHHRSRFYFDGGFPKDRCDALYEAWIERAVRDPERRLLIAVAGGEPVGYYAVAPLGPDREGHGELVAIDERHRGKGYGRAIHFGGYRHYAARGARTQRGVFSHRSLVIVRLHEREGFLIDEIQVWHHKWYPE
jgi:dTDP-4-amino-4,6-dideoxy-D-galactose acyltransferase